MNNIKKCLLLVVSLLVIFLVPNVYAEDKVFVEEITLVDVSNPTIEKSAPTKDGLNIGFDLSFTQVNDFVKYKIVVSNPTDTSYELNKNIDFNNSDYLEYKSEFEGDNNIINGNQKITIFITITYKSAVPDEMKTDGKFVENNALSLNLSNETGDTVMVPSTVDRLLLYVFTLIITSGLSITFYVATKNKKSLSIFVLGLILIPFEAYAIEQLELKIDTKVVIEEKYSVNYVYSDLIKISEEENYIIDDNYECVTVNTEYEYCSIIHPGPVLYAKGEEIPLLESIETKYLTDEGEIATQTQYFDGILRDYKLISFDSNGNFDSFGNYNLDRNWRYCNNYSLNNSNDNIQNIYTNEDNVDYGNTCATTITPNSFKMQNHNMYFYVYSMQK